MAPIDPGTGKAPGLTDNPAVGQAASWLARIGARDSEAHQELLTLLGHSVSRPDLTLARPWAALAAGLDARGRGQAPEQLTDRVRTVYDRHP